MSERGRNAIESILGYFEAKRWTYGLLGKPNSSGPPTFEVPGRRNFYFVRIRTASGAQTVVPARNDARVEQSFNLPVRMYRDRDGNYVIESVYGGSGLASPPGTPASGVPVHTHAHHGLLTPDAADDHPQYINIARGDARYALLPITATVATTDATPTVLRSFTIPATTTYTIEAKIVARRTGGAGGTAEDGAAYKIAASFKNVAGVATQIDVTTVLYEHEDQAGWDAAFDVTGATARLLVTGAASNNINWSMWAEVNMVS